MQTVSLFTYYITVCRSPFFLPAAATNNSCFTRCCTVDGYLRHSPTQTLTSLERGDAGAAALTALLPCGLLQRALRGGRTLEPLRGDGGLMRHALPHHVAFPPQCDFLHRGEEERGLTLLYTDSGSCGSGGRAGRPLIWRWFDPWLLQCVCWSVLGEDTEPQISPSVCECNVWAVGTLHCSRCH